MEAADTHHRDMWDKVFRKSDHLVSRKIAGELFLVPVRGKLADMQKIFSLNPVGEYIWQGLASRKSLRDICEGIIATFAVKRQQAESDLSAFIQQLLDANLIRELLEAWNARKQHASAPRNISFNLTGGLRNSVFL